MASSLTTAAFVASLCVALLSPAAAQQRIKCHSCEASAAENGACKDPSRGSLAVEEGCLRCEVTAFSNASGQFYSRGCSSVQVGCDSFQTESYCVCAGEFCNTQVFANNDVKVSCFECDSAAYIDNGCGKTFDEKSPFVVKKSGCTACGLTVSQENDGSGYHRRCLMDVPDTNSCAYREDQGNEGCTSRCTIDYCNSANQRGVSSSVGLALALLVVVALNKLV